MIKINNVLISVSDKTGLEEFAKELTNSGVKIISTGGTGKFLNEKGIKVVLVEDITKFPEILGGRVKTLHPKIFGGVLAIKNDNKSVKELDDNGIESIDMVVVNFYPFEKVVKEKEYSIDQIIEYIDIGGPSLVRAAAKNYKFTVPVTNPEMYGKVLKILKNNNMTFPEEESFEMAKQVFIKTSIYDNVIFNHLAKEDLSEKKLIAFEKVQDLRYGENSHQRGSFYREIGKELLWEKLHGKELSYNNIADMDTVIRLVGDFNNPVCGIIKHANPCGVGSGKDDFDSLEKALITDPVSAYGGIFGFNVEVNAETAQKLSEMFFEVIAAPSFSKDALEILMRKKNLRIIRFRKETDIQNILEIKSVNNGFILQDSDRFLKNETDWTVVTDRHPSEEEMEALKFNWKVVKYVKSNAVIFGSADKTLGVGAGQMSRVDSCRIAVMKSQQQNLNLKGSVAASDAYFPFRDGLDVLAEAGATAVIQPGGSIRDEEVIKAANEHNMAMVFTGERHFRH